MHDLRLDAIAGKLLGFVAIAWLGWVSATLITLDRRMLSLELETRRIYRFSQMEKPGAPLGPIEAGNNAGDESRKVKPK